MPHVTTPHGPANELIGCLRECAVKAKRLGDENERMVHELNEALAWAERSRSVLDDWTTLLEDFRSGIRDADELLERTVGRR